MVTINPRALPLLVFRTTSGTRSIATSPALLRSTQKRLPNSCRRRLVSGITQAAVPVAPSATTRDLLSLPRLSLLRLPPPPCSGNQRGERLYGLVAAAAVSGSLLLGLAMGQEPGFAGEMRCEGSVATAVELLEPAGAPAQEIEASAYDALSPARQELRRVALEYLTKSSMSIEAARADGDLADESENGELGGQVPEMLREQQDDCELPVDVFDMEKVLEKTPLVKADNAFFETMNTDDTIRCPYILNKPGVGIEAVVRFGKATAGHPKTVHGGVTALTFDNMLGTALFLQSTGPVFTAYLKVDYKAPLPCLSTVVVDVSIDRVEGRKLFVTGRLKSIDGEVLFACAEALFIKPRAPPGLTSDPAAETREA